MEITRDFQFYLVDSVNDIIEARRLIKIFQFYLVDSSIMLGILGGFTNVLAFSILFSRFQTALATESIDIDDNFQFYLVDSRLGWRSSTT